MGIVLHTLAALGYGILAIGPWRALAGHGSPLASGAERWGLGVVLAVHAAALFDSMAAPGGLRLGLGLALSSTMWLGMLVFWIESSIIRVDGVRLLLLPLAALGALLPVLLPPASQIEPFGVPWLGLHLILSLAAYGIMIIAALHALLMAAVNHHLHRPRASDDAGQARAWGRLFDALPPLLVLESLLFRLIAIGFALLTLSVLSGAAISLTQTGRLLPFDHKTVFTLLAWVTFGVLLLGRRIRGWRGRIAVRYTLAGLGWLVLAYAGSRFVLEVLLQR